MISLSMLNTQNKTLEDKWGKDGMPPQLLVILFHLIQVELQDRVPGVS